MTHNNVNLSIDYLLKDIHAGRLGLPDLQRPFVWGNDKIRKLYDSLIKGFPIGYIMVWQAPADYNKIKHIGTDEKSISIAQDIVIDGQQRLTALYATIYGVEIVDSNYVRRRIKISYNPFTKTFENWSAAIDKNKVYIPDIYTVFDAQRKANLPVFIDGYIYDLNEARAKKGEPEVSNEEKSQIQNGIYDLLNILNYNIICTTITRDMEEEDVAEIFVRVNSGGQTLTQDNFISTLLSVYASDIREKIENFCIDSRTPKPNTAYNELIELDSSQIIRSTAAIAFKRARLGYVYKMLRGTDLATKIVSEETLNTNISLFRGALEQVLDLNNWHAFLNIAKSAGFVNKKLVSATSTIIYSYALYLIAKNEFKLSSDELTRVFKAWFFAASLSSFYVEKTTETVAEQQLTYIKEQVTNKDEFIAFMNKSTKDRMTNDFFDVRLRNALDERNAQGPFWNGFVASQIVLGYKTLFSTSAIENLFNLGASGTKNNFDFHHIFPKHFLQEQGYTSKDFDKRANFTILDYQKNIEISDKDPQVYMVEQAQKMQPDAFNASLKQNAIPLNVTELTFEQFIEQRKDMMIQIVRDAYNTVKPE